MGLGADIPPDLGKWAEPGRLCRLVEFLEEGEDYVRAAFEWQQPGKS